jgi:hypothetical protein
MNSQNLQQSNNESESSDVPPAGETVSIIPLQNKLKILLMKIRKFWGRRKMVLFAVYPKITYSLK